MDIHAFLKRGAAAVLLIVALVLQGTTSVLAGTTGSISGVVTDSTSHAPVAGARVTALSPSQQATTSTDAGGRYVFLSLAPDTYTISVDKTSALDAAAISGVTVQADQNLTVNVEQIRTLKTIGSTTARANALVKPGTTADVYSLNATTQDRASALGGGTLLNSAWSALTSVPGVFVAPGQVGYVGAGSGVSIRGGDYDQIGYEFDGIPVNRSFDNYPSTNLSALGQQEVQVYTGATPANAEAAGLSGYVNQVIKTGTAPAYRSLTLAIGSPTLYNKIALETGGANPSRTFSYYFGAGAYNQNYRYYDNGNGNSISNTWGTPIADCPFGAPVYTRANYPSCFSPTGQDYTNGGTTPAFVLGNYALWSQSRLESRDTVLNLHFGLPTASGKDDIQVLWDNSHLGNQFYSSTNDQGGAAYLDQLSNAGGGNGYSGFVAGQSTVPTWVDAFGFNLPNGSFFNTAGPGNVLNYPYPNSPTGRGLSTTSTCTAQNVGQAASSCLPVNQRDNQQNDQGIVKLQYQKNFGTSAYLRAYGYTYFSDWLNQGPQCTTFAFNCGVSADYELSSHSRGVSLTFGKQLNAQHLVTLQGSYTTANTLRDNNTQVFNDASGLRRVVALLTDGSLNGQCYAIVAGTTVAKAVNCYNKSGSNYNSGATRVTYSGLLAGTVQPANNFTCGGAACQYLTVNAGPYATYNTVKPYFTSYSVTDDWKPTSRLTINYGLRFDGFKFVGSNTANSGARTFLYNAYNAQVANGTTIPQQFNVSGQVNTYSVLQPRIGFTYTVNPTTVLRGSYGRYSQAPNAAFQQYDVLQPNAPTFLRRFANAGIGNTPGHQILPPTSSNYDFSVEKAFKGDVAVKLTPFVRKTQNQIEQFYLDQKTGFVSGLNVGNQTSQGFELEVDKGDFGRDGIAARLSFAYTNSYLRYNRTNNGVSVVDNLNGSVDPNSPVFGGIALFNSYTKGGGGVPCYTAAGAGIANPAACVAGTVSNPYYNYPTQGLLDPNANYAPFDLFPAGVGTSYSTYGAPYVSTLLLQYKKQRLTIAPALQFVAGQRYGSPINQLGVDPSSCTATLAGGTAGDPRYPFGGSGSPYDVTKCGSTFAVPIPNAATGFFDPLGGYRMPSNFLGHLQIAYQASKNTQLVGTFSNIFYSCFGGSKNAYTVAGACSYGVPALGGTGDPNTGNNIYPVSNNYNPGAALQPQAAAVYGPGFRPNPFNFYLEARVKI